MSNEDHYNLLGEIVQDSWYGAFCPGERRNKAKGAKRVELSTYCVYSVEELVYWLQRLWPRDHEKVPGNGKCGKSALISQKDYISLFNDGCRANVRIPVSTCTGTRVLTPKLAHLGSHVPHLHQNCNTLADQIVAKISTSVLLG
jgi:hypothetical protein